MMLEALEKSQASDRAELDRISKEEGGRTIEAIFADMEKQ